MADRAAFLLEEIPVQSFADDHRFAFAARAGGGFDLGFEGGGDSGLDERVF